MRRLFLLFLFAWAGLHCTPSYRKIIPPDEIDVTNQSDVYWLYIAMEDKMAVKPEDAIGRSKKGDLVSVVTLRKNIPSAKVQQNFAIIKVTGITQKEISQFTSTWEDTLVTARGDSIVTRADRRWEIDVDFLSITKGLDTSRVAFSSIKAHINRKTSATLLGYERKCVIERYVNVPIRKLLDWTLPIRAFATEQITTCNLPGETFPDIVTWESTEDGVMTTGNPVVLECYDDDGILAGAVLVNVSGWTNNDATTQIIVRPAIGEGHTGTDSTGFQRENTGGNIRHFFLRESFTIIEGLDLNGLASTSDAIQLELGTNIIIRNMIIRNQAGRGIFVDNSAGANFELYNNDIYDVVTGIQVNEEQAGVVANNTIHTSTSFGIRANYSTGGDSTLFSNNAVFVSTTADFFGTALYKVGSTNNASDDATADDDALLNGVVNLTDTDQFTAPAQPNRDFSVLDNGADIYNAGADLSGTLVDDIIGTSRPQASTYDIGAFEFPVAAAGGSNKIMQIIKNDEKNKDIFDSLANLVYLD